VQCLVKHGLIDEYRLLIHPVVLGSGLRLFPERKQPMNLRRVSATRFDKGAVAHVYRPE
jgi:dihydrofolate reductase